MNSEEIRKWRPARFCDFVGATNQRRIARVQRLLRRGRLPSPLLLVGIFGYGKTSLARLLFRSLCCEDRDPSTSDPCNVCQQCVCTGRLYQGYGNPYRRYEYDCTSMSRSELIQTLREDLDDNRFDKPAIFMDELHHFHEKRMQEPLLKFVEDFHGIFVAAIMEDRLEEVIPPLRERFETLHLVPPSSDEISKFFEQKMREWDILSQPGVIPHMVSQSGTSFRICQKIIAAAAEEEDRTLSAELVDDMLGLAV
ncbi:MAG: AAA family ATPase [Planctomycetota bacterium]|nr:MAG: AAA family ATPase [Planctomycetota bacterium]REK25984.1 MAG: AAA family ATPase [Planctomycetota bacterium]REK46901.1 MAG: AAA family ATPase [Planctomycetota bacterium]